MVSLVPKHWFSWDFTLQDPVGTAWGEVSFSMWRERGSVIVAGQPYRVWRRGLVGPFVLEGPGAAAEAVKLSAFRQEFRLQAGGREYVLKRLSWWGRAFGLFSSGVQVGSVAPESWWTRRGKVMLPDEMPAWGRAFVVWLALLMWKRDSEAAVVGAGGGY